MDQRLVNSTLVDIIKRIKPAIDEQQITDDADLMQDLGFESFDLVRLIIDIECTFDLVVSDAFMQHANVRKYKNIRLWLINETLQSPSQN